jgi:phosphosulfolactate synthase
MKFLEGVLEPRPGKPRDRGLTHVVDRFEGLDKWEFASLADYVDVVKVRWGLPLLLDRDLLKARIKFYHSRDVRVSTGGTLCELMLRTGNFKKLVAAAASAGFDYLELSDATFPVGPQRFAKLGQEVEAAGMGHFTKAGSKDPSHQPSPEQLGRIVERGLRMGSRAVVLEAGDGYGVGLFRLDGTVNLELADQLALRFGHEKLVFEAPLESQQAALILHFGPEINLGAVGLDQMASLESMRLGVRAGATFGLRPGPKLVKGSPAAKFIYHLVSTEPLVDQGRLCLISGLPRRTVQMALEALERQGLVTASPSLDDTRRKVYRAV